MRLAVGGALMKAHGVGEADLEEIIVAGGDGCEDGGEGGAFRVGEVGETAEVAAREDQGFKRPRGPVGDEGDEEIVLDDDACFGVCEFGCDVVTQEAGAVFVVIGLLGG